MCHCGILTPAFSMVVKTPVDSTTYSAPASAHLMLLGSRLRRDKTVRASPRDARFRPPEGREGERYLLLEDGDSVPVNHEFPILSLDSAPEVTMSRVIFEHVNLAKRGGGGVGGVEGQAPRLPCPQPSLCLHCSLSSPLPRRAVLGSAEPPSPVPLAHTRFSWEATRTEERELYSEKPRGGTARQLTM